MWPLRTPIKVLFPFAGTYKFKKVDLQKEGFNIAVVKDDLYFFDTRKGSYVPLDKELHTKLCSGQMRL